MPTPLSQPLTTSQTRTNAARSAAMRTIRNNRKSVTRLGSSNTYQNGVHGSVNSNAVVNGAAGSSATGNGVSSSPPGFLPAQTNPQAPVQSQINGPPNAPGTVAQPTPSAPTGGQ